ncbi:hypothetical protein [Sorangium sp. So ce887]|uniref:hypothetical protein n=1 Tax=Sorangium sp. So ce887 TaxID=3133324 RepID=UPI003F5D64D6
MNWLDQVLAVPTVGFLLDPVLLTSHEHAAALRPLLEKWIAKNGAVGVDAKQLYQLAISVGSYQYTISHESISAQFLYGTPVVEKARSSPERSAAEALTVYSSLLQNCIEEFVGLATVLNRHHSRKLKRIGIMTAATLSMDQLPPGVETLLRHIASPWSCEATAIVGTILVDVHKNDRWTDRCHHTIDFNRADRPGRMELKLDWQRVFASEVPINASTIATQFTEWSDAALKYFDLFGAGDLSYVQG